MIEFRFFLDDDLYVLGEFSPVDIQPLHKALKDSVIYDEAGNTRQVNELCFSANPPYFYAVADDID